MKEKILTFQMPIKKGTCLSQKSNIQKAIYQSTTCTNPAIFATSKNEVMVQHGHLLKPFHYRNTHLG